VKTLADVEWDEEHPLFKGSFFGAIKVGRRKYTLVKGSLVAGGFSIGGTFEGKYQQIDVSTEEEINEILKELQL
jgi:hypothetical protein